MFDFSYHCDGVALKPIAATKSITGMYRVYIRDDSFIIGMLGAKTTRVSRLENEQRGVCSVDKKPNKIIRHLWCLFVSN